MQDPQKKKKNDSEFTIMILAVFLLILFLAVVHLALRFFGHH